ncbi:hypothetical protein WJX72_006703 [[Myrmecia] bisecta]|uniref:ABC transporter n=1 Tax=[Myrmecia] bisecta TaxID=41462 RepID=A0AAW1Q3U7_9CHLO
MGLQAYQHDLATVPLLPDASPVDKAAVGSGLSPRQHSTEQDSLVISSADLGSVFIRRLLAILAILKPWKSLLLVLLTLLEALVVAQVGKAAGSFYRILVDDRQAEFWITVSWTASLYAAATLIQATTDWLCEWLALRWRGTLASRLQQQYCHGLNFLHAGEVCDNPDQRLTTDLEVLCTTLGQAAKVGVAAPFKIAYYAAWMYTIAGLGPLLMVAAFFCMGSLVQRLLMGPVARLVYRQEQREGDFRFAHAWLRQQAEEVALCQAGLAIQAYLDATLAAALANQARLVVWHWLLSLSTYGIEYSGALLNYICIAIPVFAGAWASRDKGELAQRVSNASFASLMLIYSFTQLLDMSQKFTILAGMTGRVGQLAEALTSLPALAEDGSVATQPDRHTSERAFARVASSSGGGGTQEVDGRQLVHAELAQMLQLPRRLDIPWLATQVEVSVHLPGPGLQAELLTIFPDAPANSLLLAIPTFQFAADGVDLAPGHGQPEQVACEMDHMLANFLEWEGCLRRCLAERGCWSDAVDPRTGSALIGRPAARWSEATGARTLLGYQKLVTDVCQLVVHPVKGTSVYPATIFTNASGCGKTTFIRTLAGLHLAESGAIVMPPHGQVMFVPQRVLASPGRTLREQVTFPSIEPASHSHLVNLLAAVGLERLLDRVDGDCEACADWQGMLSPGELQRLTFARILHHQPRLVVMDEPTCAIATTMEARMFLQLQQLEIAVLATGQNGMSNTWTQFDTVIELADDGQGGWSLQHCQHKL